MTALHVTLQPTLTCRRERKIDISEGATVTIAGWDGKTRRAKITGHGEKDGRNLVDLSDGHWAYLDQIESGSPAKPGSQEMPHYSSNRGWGDDDWS